MGSDMRNISDPGGVRLSHDVVILALSYYLPNDIIIGRSIRALYISLFILARMQSTAAFWFFMYDGLLA